MWERYRQTFLLTQMFIVVICAVLLVIGASWQGLLIPIVVMEIGGIYGSRWAERLTRSGDERLPRLKNR